jgi:membrane protein required for colicin V production
MEFNYFDLIATIIIILLGLKGIINGFFKELFGLIGIVGGIFIASRVGDKVGIYLSELIFKFDNSSAIGFTGFLATLFLFWFLMVFVGFIFKKLSSLSGLGPIDRLLGFVFGAGKFFLIAAVIAYAVYNIKAIRGNIDSAVASSILFPVLVQTGSFIMKIDPVEIADDINSSITKNAKVVQEKIEGTINTSPLDMIQETKEQIKKSMPETAKTLDTNLSDYK